MILNFNVLISCINALLYLCILPEINSLPRLHDTLGAIMGVRMNYVTCYLLNVALFVVLPVIYVTALLGILKRQVFSESKCVKQSYSTVTYILMSTYLLRVFKTLFIFFTKLGISEPFYLYIRLARHNNSMTSYLFQYDLFAGFMVHALTFVVAFAIAEMSLTYSALASEMTTGEFLRRNKPSVALTTVTVLFYLTGIIMLEKSIAVYTMGLGTMLTMIFTRLYESVLINGLCLYLYVLICSSEFSV